MKLLKIFALCILLVSVSADLLQNPDFEIPPSNWSTTSSSFFKLNGSTIAGWSFEGDANYATAGANISLPQKSVHAIVLGQDAKINQTFTASGDEKEYLLTFTLARNVTLGCTTNASLVVSAPDSSAQFDLALKFGDEPWEVYGHRIGSWMGGEPINLVIESEDVDADPESTCWPVVDGLSLVTIGPLVHWDDNLLQNGGFELGPSFPEYSKDGVLLISEPSLIESALPQWTVMGTIKYINAKNFFVPEGNAAVELISTGTPGGVQTVKQLTQGSKYTLEFRMGDANDSCTGDFTLGVLAGSLVQNFTINSKGTGSASKYSVVFEGSSATQISFQSYMTKQREDGVFCGPLIDGVVLRSSSGYKWSANFCFLIALLLIVLMKISE